uniref:ATP-dependent DNA helicase n=2 Tax=Brassica oleracea TaxID=3712 RepID=A0A0D3BZP1_BRAOL
MFVTFLTNCFVASPKDLWEHSWKSMSEDILHKRQRILGHTNLELDDETLEQYTLIEVEKLMRMHDRSLNDIKDMPKIKPVLLKELRNSLWNQEMDYDVAEETLRHDRQYNLLNAEQRTIYESVLDSVDKKDGKLFFVYGAGGTGKTFLYQTIISRLRSRKQIVLPVASSGIAALLLPNGRTAHYRFNIPLKLDENKLCNIKPNTMMAELIEKMDLIIWDEAPMTHKHAFEALDKSLKDIMSIKNPPAKDQTFRGKAVLLGGAFRQILPDEKEFSEWLLKVGESRPESGQEDEGDGYHDQMITVENSLGKSLKDVILYLPRPVFAHGQLYVALSRVTSKEGLKFIKGEDSHKQKVKNIVYKEIFNRLLPMRVSDIENSESH